MTFSMSLLFISNFLSVDIIHFYFQLETRCLSSLCILRDRIKVLISQHYLRGGLLPHLCTWFLKWNYTKYMSSNGQFSNWPRRLFKSMWSIMETFVSFSSLCLCLRSVFFILFPNEGLTVQSYTVCDSFFFFNHTS